jgi:hypothetical protein
VRFAEDVMRVHELVASLIDADPEALVPVFPQHADFSDGAVLRDVIVPRDLWTRETGMWSGVPYETFYPEEQNSEIQQSPAAAVERVAVVLMGEDLGNFRLSSR